MAESAPPQGVDPTEHWRSQMKDVSDNLLTACGSSSRLALHVAMTGFDNRKRLPDWLVDISLKHQHLAGASLILFQPTISRLQRGMTECQCSPFGRLHVLNCVGSGSLAERLPALRDGPQLTCSSDSDLMIELGPVQWVTADGEQLTPAATAHGEQPNTDTSSDTRSVASSAVSRLVIAETENPGFLRVLQEKSPSCTHAEQLPFERKRARSLLDACYKVYCPERQRNTAGPSTSSSITESELSPLGGQVTEHDHVACLYVPGWWPSDEFFQRTPSYDWPPKAVRDEIRVFGVHLVPVGASGSPTEDTEWRLSCSRAELVLASYLTEIQAWSLIAFKTCKSAMGAEGKSVKSYFAKTALFWLCQVSGSFT